MMKLVYKIGLALLLIAGIATSVCANDLDRREFSKTIKKEFNITATGTTAIYNKYGKVEIKTWDRNRVKVDVRIIVNASNEGEAQRVFDRIDVNFYNKSNYVKAETQIEPAKRSWWESWMGSDKDSDYTINYEVFVPPTNNVELGNKYGDSYVADLQGSVKINVKYGNFKVQSVNNDANVALAYGNGSLLSARGLTGEVAYAKFDCGEISDANVTSKYSRLHFDKANNIISLSKNDTYEIEKVSEFRNEGKYDNFFIVEAQDVIVVSKYTQVNVEQVTNLLDLNLSYGGASVEQVARDFTSVNLVGSHTDYNISIASGANFKFDASADYGNVNYPRALSVSREIEKGTSHEVQGHLGSQSARGTITARLNHGRLKLKQE